MKLNGVDGTMKGHVFDPQKPDTLPTFVLRMSQEKQTQWAQHETERYKIIERCKICKRLLIAEELQAHKLNHVPYGFRSLARMLLELSQKNRAELLKWVKEIA